jgi:hypothetical protein
MIKLTGAGYVNIGKHGKDTVRMYSRDNVPRTMVHVWSYGADVRTLFYTPDTNGRLIACLHRCDPCTLEYLRKNGKTKCTISLRGPDNPMQHGTSSFYRRSGKLKREMIFYEGTLKEVIEYDKGGYWVSSTKYKNKMYGIGFNILTLKSSSVEYNIQTTSD